MPATGRLRARQYVAAAAVLALVGVVTLAGCSGDDDPSDDETGAGETTSEPAEEPSDSTSTDPTDPTDEPPAGGTADDPAELEAQQALLDWEPVDSSVADPADDTATVGDKLTVTVDQEGTEATITGQGPLEGQGQGISEPGRRITDVFVSDTTAVVVLMDEQETEPTIARAIDVQTGKETELGGDADVVPASGGTWTLGDDGRLYYPTFGEGNRYCLASAPLSFDEQQVEWCAQKRHGYRGTTVTPAGVSLLGFDNARPVSCRTEYALADGEATGYEGVTDCKAWEGLLTEQGAVWSVLPKEQRQETGAVYARVGDGYFDLGPNLAGSLIWCGDAAYFARDPLKGGGPAELLRWTGDGSLSVVYQSPSGGEAILSEPRCADGRLTVTALTESGDEQVTAAAD